MTDQISLNTGNAAVPHIDENHVIQERRHKLAAIREKTGGRAFPNDYRPEHRAVDLHAEYGERSKQDLEANKSPLVRVAGRIMLKRVMGKASFATIQDASGRIQLYVNLEGVGEAALEEFKHFDLGDIVGAEGVMFKTKTGELSINVSSVRLITKSLRPLPEKFHGLTDTEQRYRMRYVDLMVNPEVKRTFETRSKVVSEIRRFMVEAGYLEVETPMMHPIPGG
ncbi:MAG: OB-fold nucleic acid binding domain-containing protein, partial [Burkholderiales bacterium]